MLGLLLVCEIGVYSLAGLHRFNVHGTATKKDQTTNNNTRSTYTDSSPRINLHEPHILRG